ncbi:MULTISPECIES: pyrroloquinoline quinone biosynthesis protein PqqE [unclassified Amycolatopsis]|uniref:pyrroloquinoline quinone biosynthesis protein PqqE n=1 Tax=unclassified Amycolatopsis TaxID=2618356 RepID=UPI0028747858|nr:MULTISPECIES: pyrroloquinoline quinone biosynthesis protein PqqE [unclassified Amycolatopsis]MDS0137241.1 pyrroloquinoline quinone biosynthesis protein PqqE [Amycolatopsis sp. 505]MDS0141436.1 pyrroloquinoline quinone biosynthesis protein PqqE [Amycolatopsis sp. CM201R]
MDVSPPLGLLAELTHRCPLHCPYCSNPVELTARDREMSTEDWLSVLSQARELGVLQVHLSGGEPLLRPDLPALVAHAHGLGCYVNLVTSGLGLTSSRLDDLVARGLAHVQLSAQGATRERADRLAGAKAHDRKLSAAELVKAAGLPLSLNVVLHRQNHDQLAGIIELAERMGADRLELANTQYYGWALRNRDALMPTAAQLAAAEPVVRAAIDRLRGTMEIVYVVADYHEPYPKPCMYGWGARQLTVAPDGTVLPCPAASAISTLSLSSVRDTPLAEIWYRSSSFNAYRGEEWMSEPCRTCDRRGVDFGGCRCQAFLLTGDAAATDPVCSRSPQRGVVDLVLSRPAVPDLVMRR